MRAVDANLKSHLESGATTIARAWVVERRDGVVMGFTDHDKPLSVDGFVCEPDSGLDASAVERSTGLAVDNAQAVGALSSAGIRDVDIERGLYDGAKVSHWLVNWQDTSQALLQFRGSLGEIRRGNGAFEAELRGLAEPLNTPVGRVYLRRCDRVLGDDKCKVDLSGSTFTATATVDAFQGRKVVELPGLSSYSDGWFTQGSVTWITGQNAGSTGLVRQDQTRAGVRVVELWEETALAIAAGDQLRIIAGCDKAADTCRAKFNNLLNFRGFPHLPGEDWSVAYPVSGTNMDGGSRSGA